LLAVVPGIGGALARRLPVQDMLGLAGQALLLCAIAGEPEGHQLEAPVRLPGGGLQVVSALGVHAVHDRLHRSGSAAMLVPPVRVTRLPGPVGTRGVASAGRSSSAGPINAAPVATTAICPLGEADMDYSYGSFISTRQRVREWR
jgi:hypothetical protein